MKAILISIKPEWCAKIMNGDKTIEFRTSKALATAIQKLIDEYGYADIHVYCSKDGYLHLENDGKWSYSRNQKYTYIRSGKVLFKFRCYKVEEIDVRLGHPKIYIKACVGDLWCLENRYHDENYLVRAIHISDLEIFDRPRELSEFRKQGEYCKNKKSVIKREWLCEWCNRLNCIGDKLTKAPQNFCYVEVE